MAPASERAGRVDTAHMTPHKSIKGAWPMADGRMAARLAGRWPLAAWPPGSLAAGRMAARLAGRWPLAARASPMGTRAGPAADGHGSGGATNKIFYSPHCPHNPQIFKFIFYVYWTHTHGDCQQSLAIWGFQSLDKQCPAVLARRVNV